ncbi:MAG: PKD domain-containing protein, partial [Bacteroidota bacterium]
PNAAYSFIIDQFEVELINESERSNSFIWITGDTVVSIESDPMIDFDTTGIYDLMLVAINDCGNDTLQQVIDLTFDPVANFSYNRDSICPNDSIAFESTSTGRLINLKWLFEGGNIDSSELENPVVIFDSSGIYGVSLIVENSFGEDTLEISNAIHVLNEPKPSFTFEQRGDTIFLINNSEFANTYSWNFGNGSVSEEESPFVLYDTTGFYTVSLNASNGVCENITADFVNFISTSLDEPILSVNFNIYPNPAKATIFIKADQDLNHITNLAIYNSLGKRILIEQVESSLYEVDIRSLINGIYFMSIETQNRVIGIQRFVKK